MNEIQVRIAKDLTYNEHDDSYSMKYKTYKRIPNWIKFVLKKAEEHNLNVPQYIFIYNGASFHIIPEKNMTRLGGYWQYKQPDGEIYGVAFIFALKHSIEHKCFFLAHEIGHHEHWSKNILLETKELQEEFANSIASMLTGIDSPNLKSIIEELT